MNTLIGKTYHVFTGDTKPDEAKAKFVQRWGHEPEQVFVNQFGYLCLGPVTNLIEVKDG